MAVVSGGCGSEDSKQSLERTSLLFLFISVFVFVFAPFVVLVALPLPLLFPVGTTFLCIVSPASPFPWFWFFIIVAARSNLNFDSISFVILTRPSLLALASLLLSFLSTIFLRVVCPALLTSSFVLVFRFLCIFSVNLTYNCESML